jgi:prepilin-type N-terminal cleavage/methylation domain-containing protein
MHKKAFTLIELLVIIVILGTLAALLSGNFINSLKKGRDAKRKADLDQVQKALEMHYEDKRAYPLELTFGSQFIESGSNKVYMQRLPNDPLPDRDYAYEVDSSGLYYRLYACLENSQQILPYTAPLSKTIDFPCNVECLDQAGAAVECIWATSSTNTTP